MKIIPVFKLLILIKKQKLITTVIQINNTSQLI